MHHVMFRVPFNIIINKHVPCLTKLHKLTCQFDTDKMPYNIPKISHGLIFAQPSFKWAYFWGGLTLYTVCMTTTTRMQTIMMVTTINGGLHVFSDGNLFFKNLWVSTWTKHCIWKFVGPRLYKNCMIKL